MFAPRRRTRISFFVCCVAVLGSSLVEDSGAVQAQEKGILKHFPSSANALTVIDIDALLATKMAQKEGWGDKTHIKHAERPLQLPVLAKQVAIAAQLNSSDDLSRVWELAVIEPRKPVAMHEIALREGGYIDEIDGIPAVWTPSDTYFVALESNLLGAMYPANRQFISRWVQHTKTNQLLKLSDYLLRTAARLQPDTQIVMGLDLKNVVQPHRITQTLEGLEMFAGKEDQVEQAAKLLTGLKGLTLSIQVDEKAHGMIRIDFSEDVSSFGRLAKPLFLEALNRFGALIPDFESWDAELLGETVILSGPLSTSGLRRIGSILELPSTKFSDLEDAAPVESGADAYVKASQAYFRSVKALIDDLRHTLSTKRDNQALWMERYGRKIDALPILNVDDQLLNWGARVAETFRSMSVTERSANVRAGTRKAYVNTGASGYSGYNNGGRYGSAWYSDATASAKQKTQIDRSEKGKARIERFGSWKEVEDSMAETRIAMTRKYNVEF